MIYDTNSAAWGRLVGLKYKRKQTFIAFWGADSVNTSGRENIFPYHLHPLQPAAGALLGPESAVLGPESALLGPESALLGS